MSETTKLAVSPPIQLGGSLFTPEQLRAIESLTNKDAKVEMTTFKQLYVEVPVELKDSIQVELEQAGLEVNPAGFAVKSLIACNFCRGAEDAGLETARILNKAIAGMESPTPLKIGYAGCALGTSEPLLKDIGVVKMRETFDIFVGGEPKGLKTAIARLLVTGITEKQLIPTVRTLVDLYIREARGKEKFSKFVTRMTIERLMQELGA